MNDTQSSPCPQRGQGLIKQRNLPGAIKFPTKGEINLLKEKAGFLGHMAS